MGATARGEGMEVGTYIEHALTSELSGNLIDICPVGALTSKPYAFVARPWELRKTDSIDVLDAVGASIRVDSRGPEVLRILPRLNEDVNEEWLADKSRFAIDGLKRRRLDSPWVREGGRLRKATWAEAFSAIARRLQDVPGGRIGAVAGALADAESMIALKDLFTSLGSANLDCRQGGEAVDTARRDFYVFNSSIAGIEEADALLLIGTNPRREAPLINARIRKRTLSGRFTVAGIGQPVDLTYKVDWLGDALSALAGLIDGSHPFATTLRGAKKPMLILGQAALARPDGAAVLAAAWKLAAANNMLTPEWHGFNVLHTEAARVGALDLGFLPGPGGKGVAGMLDGGVDVLWLLGADELDTSRIGADTFVVYQGHHGDRGAARADVILPGAAYTEKNGTYVNTEGRVQRAQLAVYPPGDAREDWAIIRALSAEVGKPLPYDTLGAVRERLVQVNPVFGRVGILPRFACSDQTGPAGDVAAVGDAPLGEVIANYYQTDPISRASPTMAECTALRTPALMAAE
jgi:NADH-quinone oxidoreductase subunit G